MADGLQFVEVKAVCPRCGSKRYVTNGAVGNVIYKKCLGKGCGHTGRVLRFLSSEVVGVVMKRE